VSILNFLSLVNTWCNLAPAAKVIIVTDSNRLELALEIQYQIPNNCRVINIDETKGYLDDLLALAPSDLVIALFSFDTFVLRGANRIFSPFGKPLGLKAKYVFIRLGISRES
jgi:hypothetical protein